ncbi:hypothetical protein BDV19DRAFT_374290 [Aspergillus venezuelensis]
MLTARAAGRCRSLVPFLNTPTVRNATIASPATFTGHSHKIVVIGGGTAGLSISHQLLRSKRFTQDDIAIIDPATWHHYQPGWTLVGGGVKSKEKLRRPMKDLINSKIKFYNSKVNIFNPEDNSITLDDDRNITYEQLVVAPGIQLNWGSVKGLPQALADSHVPVSSIYGYDYCDTVFGDIKAMKKGTALFTQPAGIVKCAGAPQKIMWLALDYWKKAGLYTSFADSPVTIKFASGLPSIFGVPKYAATLDELRRRRGVEGFFQHDLVAIDGNQAVFNATLPDGKTKQVTKRFDMLHVVPKMGPYGFVKESPISNDAGYVEVNDQTMQHKRYKNIWSCGDASSLPTSKTMAAIGAQAPVLSHNLLRAIDGKSLDDAYDGYTSCPLTTEYGKVLLAEFKYGGEPSETFKRWFRIDQGTPRRAFYYLKRDFFPWVYYNSMVKGTWRGPKGWSR